LLVKYIRKNKKKLKYQFSRSFKYPATNRINKQKQQEDKKIKLISNKINLMSNESQLLSNVKRLKYNNNNNSEKINDSNNAAGAAALTATSSKSTGYNTFVHVSNSNTNGSKTIRDNYPRVNYFEEIL